MRLLLAGDTHANKKHMEYLFRMAGYFDCDLIFQVGDYGFWPHNSGGQRFLKLTQKLTVSTGIPLYWLDGNHEDHNALDVMVAGTRDQFIPTKVPYKEDADVSKFLYSPRGHRFEFDGVTFMTVGGAYSVDKAARTPNVSWFAQEKITDEDVEYASRPGKVDIVLSHDVPTVSPILEKLLIHKGRRYKLIEEAEHSRNQLEKIRKAVRPELWVHGHYHVEYKHEINGTKFMGLDCDGHDGFSWTLLDTEDWK